MARATAKARTRKAASPKKPKRKGRTAPGTPRAAGGAGAGGSGASVTVRMYRGLLGDFFVVRHTAGERVFRMVIDCGVLQCIGTASDKPSTALGKERIRAGVADLMKEVGGRIDLIVATHEHYDHLSGFILANDAYEPLAIDKVWMAWTEDRSDKVANRYRNDKKRAVQALAALAQSRALAATDEVATVTNLLQFHGPIEGGAGGAMAAAKTAANGKLAGNASCEAALEWLRQKAGATNVSFLKPGQAAAWGVDGGLRAYVLGPPRDDAQLRKLDPSKGPAREVYLARSEDVATIEGLAAVHRDASGTAGTEGQPFSRPYWNAYDTRSHRTSARRRFPILKRYEDPADRERRIDTAWLGSAETLALKIDGDVNNTSLALALELPGKEILLFAADAQVGNWLSWGDQSYPASDAVGGATLSIEDILSRTILYKVGHHASHNATLQARGLELMRDPRLCAMIPLVEKTAAEQKTKTAPNGWAMPYGALYKRLTGLTDGRIVRGDGDVATETGLFKQSPFTIGYGPNFKAKDPLWVELTVAV